MKHKCPKCQAELDLTGVKPGAKFSCSSCKGEFQLVPEDGPLPPSTAGGRGCLTCMIPVAVLFLSFLGGMIIAWPSVQRRIEKGFTEVLRQQASSQEEYRKKKLRDDDGDGVGEYVFIADMPNLNAPIAEGEAPFGVPVELKAKAAKRGGVVPLGAYSLVFYLPLADGSWERDTGFKPPVDEASKKNADARESAFIAYAFPNYPGWLGSRAFVVDQGGSVWYCDNEGAEQEEAYSPDNVPAPAAAYPTPRAALDGPIAETGSELPTTDGRAWRVVE